MVAVLAAPTTACSSPPSPEGSARIRADQVGFVTDEATRAYRMSADAAESFRVVEVGGAPVFEGVPSPSAAKWNIDSVPHAFGLVITADLYRSVTGDGRYNAFGTAQRGWVLGANAWGSFVVGVGEVFPLCPEHQEANLIGVVPTGTVVNGPNAAGRFAELNAFAGMKPCAVEGFEAFDGQGAR